MPSQVPLISHPHPVPTPGEIGLRRILAVADVLLGGMEEAELVDRLLPVLRRAVPADTVLWLTSDRWHPAAWRAEPAGSIGTEQAAALDPHAEDPLLTEAWHGAGTATRRSDLHTDAEFHRLPLFQSVFAPMGARRQLIMAVQPDEQRRVVVLFNRSAPDFAPQDVAVAESLRPRIGRALARFGGPLPRRAKVSPREADVLDLLCRGLTDRQIATRLGISPRTVDKHLEHAYVKLGVRCRVQAASRWRS
ncbi:helix-turn-helix domain-containing protein [Catenulispora sp. NF23]|uniref:Helix-turn-helix domain-containing protein n=1 Tax=Catenulispora pinistramenti TaxID=2705254 RepID=A0ABS5L3T1_9ACTN|nr:LuxR family transcriptional regulator [Catenulispora pinistramenti]MBS2536622.1 helix-turn-helix domain-containing protein [Catenulispora pinistramenti]MBS2553001.1 helix-turn-helix domain-containing protein [Catenulispora pinistramenti]